MFDMDIDSNGYNLTSYWAMQTTVLATVRSGLLTINNENHIFGKGNSSKCKYWGSSVENND